MRQCYVCNPTTKRGTKIDCPGVVSAVNLAIAFDPTRSQAYHIIFVKLYIQEIHVYSSQTKSWTRFTPEALNMGMAMAIRAYWDGAIYWTNLNWDFAVCFEIAQGNLKIVPFPSDESIRSHLANGDKLENCYFGVCGDHLYLIQKVSNSYAIESEVFVILELEKGLSPAWTTKYRVKYTDLATCLSNFGYVMYNKINFLSINIGEDMKLELLISIDVAVLSFCPQTVTAKVVHRLGSSKYHFDESY